MNTDEHGPSIRSILALVGLCLFLTPGAARASQKKVTGEDLVRLVLPEMHEEAETGATSYGPTAIPVRHFAGDQEPAILEGITGLGAAMSWEIPDGAAMRYVLYVEVQGDGVNEYTPFEGDGALVAVFDAGPSPKLLDLVEVKSDRETDIGWGGPVSSIGAKARAFTVYNEHSNSSQTYHSYTVICVHDGKLELVADTNLLSWRGCTEEVSEDPTFRVRPRRGSPLGDLVVTVRLKRLRGRDCDFKRSRPSVRSYVETYRWDASTRKYVDAGGTLGVVDKLNAASY